jgi:hypothetical protein
MASLNQLLTPDASPLGARTPPGLAARATQWFNQRLVKRAQRRRALPSSGAFALPTEIILMITSHLEFPSTISLALTCRTLYSVCFPKSPPSNLAEKKELLGLLEKDAADSYVCHRCVKLHNWRKSHSRWTRGWHDKSLPCQRFPDDRLTTVRVGHIPYYYARLIMNRHFYGPAHGPRLKNLDKWRSSFHHPDGVVDTESRHARIVDDQLLISSTTTKSRLYANSDSLKQHIDEMKSIRVCKHTLLAGSWPRYTQLSKFVENADALSEARRCGWTLRSCNFCLTDYSVSMSWKGAKKGYVVKVFIDRQLGDCRDPCDWSWRSQVQFPSSNTPRITVSDKYNLGYVRDQWLRADGILFSSHGEWASHL